MITLKNNGLLASLILSALFMAGTISVASANENDKEKKKKDQPKTEKKMLSPQWFEYTGPARSSTDPNNPYDPLNPANYTPMGSGTPSCDEGTQVCAVKVIPNEEESHPDQDALLDLADEIAEEENISDQLLFRPAL